MFSGVCAKLGPNHARGRVIPRTELCFLSLPAHYGLIHMGERKSAAQGGTSVGRGKGRGKPLPSKWEGSTHSPFAPLGGAAGFKSLRLTAGHGLGAGCRPVPPTRGEDCAVKRIIQVSTRFSSIVLDALLVYHVFVKSGSAQCLGSAIRFKRRAFLFKPCKHVVYCIV